MSEQIERVTRYTFDRKLTDEEVKERIAIMRDRLFGQYDGWENRQREKRTLRGKEADLGLWKAGDLDG